MVTVVPARDIRDRLDTAGLLLSLDRVVRPRAASGVHAGITAGNLVCGEFCDTLLGVSETPWSPASPMAR